MRRIIVCIIVSLVSFLTYAQEKKEPTYSSLDKFLQIDKQPLEASLKFPRLHIGTGIVSYHGDVTNDEPANFSVGCNGFHFEMLQSMTPSIRIGIRYLRSELRGNQYFPDINTYFNFKTDIQSFGAFVHYDFSNIKGVKRNSGVVSPYLSAGISLLQRPEARGDWYADGNKMFLWSDGSFRTIDEHADNASEATILYRDYDYETALQVENIDKKDYYTPLIATLPLEMGLTFHVSKAFKLNLGYQYHITFTNTLDDITGNGTSEARKGSHLPDGFSYAYVALSADIANIQKNKKFETLDNYDYYVEWDADEDGIDETEDDCPYTPKGVTVFANGCPLDDDKDGIPNYLDEEPFSRSFWVDAKGRGITEAQVRSRLTHGDAVRQDELYVYYPDLLNGQTLSRQLYKRIPKKFRPCDLDKNEYIDINEVQNAINSFFDDDPNSGPGANMSTQDLMELIEFFFLQ